MGIKVLNIAVLMVYGAMLADILSHGQTSQAVIKSVTGAWNTSLQTVAGQ